MVTGGSDITVGSMGAVHTMRTYMHGYALTHTHTLMVHSGQYTLDSAQWTVIKAVTCENTTM